MNWEPYLNDRMIAKHPSGFYVIKTKDISHQNKPLFCPVCDYLMNSVYDEETYEKFSCCDNCANKWVYIDQDRWKSGWRPTSDEINNNFKEKDHS